MDNSYDEFIDYYFNLGEKQIKRYLKASKLTSTLYLVIQKFIIFKVEVALEQGTSKVFVEDIEGYNNNINYLFKIDDFFLNHSRILNHYRQLVNLEN